MAPPVVPKQDLPGSGRRLPPSASGLEDVAAEEVIEVAVALRWNPTTEYLRSRIIATGARPSPDAYARAFHARNEDVAAVVTYFEKAGFVVTSSSSAGRYVGIKGTAAAFTRYFGVALRHCTIQGAPFRVRAGMVQAPSEVAERIAGIFGLDNRPVGRAHGSAVATTAVAAGAPRPLTVNEIVDAYGFPPELSGEGQTVAIIEFGGGYKVEDLEQACPGLSARVTTKVVDIAGHAKVSSPPPLGAAAINPNFEVAMDLQVVGIAAPKASIIVYFAARSSAGWRAALTAVLGDPAAPSVASISYGDIESSLTPSLRSELDRLLLQASAKGIATFVSSGDHGSCNNTKERAVMYPAASPYVTSCGGTVLQLDPYREVVWNNELGATGGGFSSSVARPSWQTSVPAGSPAGRGVPDVAGHADSCLVVYNGKSGGGYGTSLVAPLWAALAARIHQALPHRWGVWTRYLYQFDPDMFSDVCEGSNGPEGIYTAVKGWDACTGLGSPRGGRILTGFQGTTPPSTT